MEKTPAKSLDSITKGTRREKKKLNELIIHAAFDVEKDDLPASHVNGIDRGGTEFQPCVD